MLILILDIYFVYPGISSISETRDFGGFQSHFFSCNAHKRNVNVQQKCRICISPHTPHVGDAHAYACCNPDLRRSAWTPLSSSEFFRIAKKSGRAPVTKPLTHTPDSHVPGSQKEPGSWILRIQHPGSWTILDLIFTFSHGILEILDPVTATLPRDPRDLGSRTEKILPDPGYPGSCLI